MRGIVGMWVLPLFVGFCSVVFGIGIVWNYLPHMMGIGYVGGSIGLDILTANSKSSQEVEILPPAPQLTAAPKIQPVQQGPAESFQFATWDDEEAKR
jgi:hypothetical protein